MLFLSSAAPENRFFLGIFTDCSADIGCMYT